VDQERQLNALSVKLLFSDKLHCVAKMMLFFFLLRRECDHVSCDGEEEETFLLAQASGHTMYKTASFCLFLCFLLHDAGLTESGKQRTPDWLSDLLGVERAPQPSEESVTMQKLFGGALPQ
jgi:hypothetical protein